MSLKNYHIEEMVIRRQQETDELKQIPEHQEKHRQQNKGEQTKHMN